MQARLLSRETGDLSPQDFSRYITSHLLRSFAPAPHHRFNGDTSSSTPSSPAAVAERAHNLRAHAAGVASLALEKFDGRILVSGGAEGAIKLWDLEACGNPHRVYTFRPVGVIPRAPRDDRAAGGHTHGITHLAFYPFDPDAFLSSAYDKTLKLWATQTCQLSGSFDLNATIYSHSTSPVADHLLVAAATQNPNVRLVDLKSGSAVQALVAHGGPVLSTVWSPLHEHVLASGHSDGKVRIWDIRRAGGVIAQLDQDDHLGVVDRYNRVTDAGEGEGWSQAAHFRASAKAHDEAVNALQWTDDGRHIVSAGLDSQIHVWDAATGANTLASFGSVVQNGHARTASLLVTPSSLSVGNDLLVWANDHEILFFDLHEGNVVTRLRSPAVTNHHPIGPRGGRSETGRSRISSVVWRGAGGGGRQVGPVMGGGNSLGAIYSAHMDGQIRAWEPHLSGFDDVGEEEMDEDEETKMRKRKAIDSAYRSLMGKKITFT